MNITDTKSITDREAVIAELEKNPIHDDFGDDKGEELIQMGSDRFEGNEPSESASVAPDASSGATTPAGVAEPSPPSPADPEVEQLRARLTSLETDLTESRRSNQYLLQADNERRQWERQQYQQQYQHPTGVQQDPYQQYQQYDPGYLAANAMQAAEQTRQELAALRQENAIAEMRRNFEAAEREFASKNPDFDSHVNPQMRKMALGGMETAIRQGKDLSKVNYRALFDTHYSVSKVKELEAENARLKQTHTATQAQGQELNKLRGIPNGGTPFQAPAPDPAKDKAKSKIGSSDYRTSIMDRARQLFRAG